MSLRRLADLILEKERDLAALTAALRVMEGTGKMTRKVTPARFLSDFACQIRDGILLAISLAAILYLLFFTL